MKKVIVSFAASMLCGLAFATDSYTTIRHAQITPTNRVVTSIPTWAQSDTPPGCGGADTNAVNDLIREYDTTNLAARINYRTTTNDVNAIIASSNLCTVSAAQAMTNGFYKLPQGGIGRSDLNDEVNTSLNNADSALDASLAFNTFAQKSITLSGYGIEDAYTKSESENVFVKKEYNPYTEAHINKFGWKFSPPTDSQPASISTRFPGGGGFTEKIRFGGPGSVGALIGDWSFDDWDSVRINFATESLPDYIGSESVTNGGAKAFAEATFVSKTGAVVRTTFKIREYENNKDIIRKDTSVDGVWHFVGVADTCESVGAGNYIYIKRDGRKIVFDTSGYAPPNASELTPDRSPVVTSNMLERVIASKPAPSPLTGKTYDFANGSNFTKNLYIALTNVIQTLGGTVTNAPALD